MIETKSSTFRLSENWARLQKLPSRQKSRRHRLSGFTLLLNLLPNLHQASIAMSDSRKWPTRHWSFGSDLARPSRLEIMDSLILRSDGLFLTFST